MTNGGALLAGAPPWDRSGGDRSATGDADVPTVRRIGVRPPRSDLS
jgi:hypothetical protein